MSIFTQSFSKSIWTDLKSGSAATYHIYLCEEYYGQKTV